MGESKGPAGKLTAGKRRAACEPAEKGRLCRGLLRCAAADHAVRGSGRRRTVVCGAHDGTAGQRVHAGRQEPLFREGDTVDTVLAKMTLAEKVGQMFIVRCPEQGAAEKAAEYHLGGYILFRENFEEKTPVQAAEMVRACQAAAALPMLVWMKRAGPSTVSADIRLSATRPLLRRRSCTRRAALTRCGKMRWKNARFLKNSVST